MLELLLLSCMWLLNSRYRIQWNTPNEWKRQSFSPSYVSDISAELFDQRKWNMSTGKSYSESAIKVHCMGFLVVSAMRVNDLSFAMDLFNSIPKDRCQLAGLCNLMLKT